MIKFLFRKNRGAVRQIFTILALMVLVAVIMAILKPASYFTVKNAKSMIFQFPEYGILALGMMLCMISGGIDLSLVGIMNLSGMTAAYVLLALVPESSQSSDTKVTLALCLACVCALAVGALCGILNGMIISGIPFLHQNQKLFRESWQIV